MSPVLNHSPIWTWEDFAALPDDARYQVLDGEVFVSPFPTWWHQRALVRLSSQLYAYAEEHHLGAVVHEINLVMGRGRYVGPDIVFIPNERLPGTGGPEGGEPDLWVHVPPALIVELLSPSTRQFDRTHKKQAYREFGVDEYWIVAPDAEHVEVYRFADIPMDATVTPQICRERVLWQPDADLPPCEIAVPELWKR